MCCQLAVNLRCLFFCLLHSHILLIVQVLLAFLRHFFSPDSGVIYSYYLFFQNAGFLKWLYNCVSASYLLYNYLLLKAKPCCSLVCELDSFWLMLWINHRGSWCELKTWEITYLWKPLNCSVKWYLICTCMRLCLTNLFICDTWCIFYNIFF